MKNVIVICKGNGVTNKWKFLVVSLKDGQQISVIETCDELNTTRELALILRRNSLGSATLNNLEGQETFCNKQNVTDAVIAGLKMHGHNVLNVF